jgi:hypothetical protein
MIGRFSPTQELIEVVGWEEEDHPDGTVSNLTTRDGRLLRVFVSLEESAWLSRSRHPAFRRDIDPFIKRMASTALQIELVPAGKENLSVDLLHSQNSGVTRSSIGLSTAVLLASHIRLPVLVHPQLLTGEIYEEADGDSFHRFLLSHRDPEGLR